MVKYYQVVLTGLMNAPGSATIAVTAQDVDTGYSEIVSFFALAYSSFTLPEQFVNVGERWVLDLKPYFSAPYDGTVTYDLLRLDNGTYPVMIDHIANQLTTWGNQVDKYHFMIKRSVGGILKEQADLTLHIVPTLISKGQPLWAVGAGVGTYYVVPKNAMVPMGSVTTAAVAAPNFDAISVAKLVQTDSSPVKITMISQITTGENYVYKMVPNSLSSVQVRAVHFKVLDYANEGKKTDIADIVKYLQTNKDNLVDLNGDGVINIEDIKSILNMLDGENAAKIIPFTDPFPAGLG